MTEPVSSISTMSEQTERLLGFSDAVFAIAMTFLALDLGNIPAEIGTSSLPVAEFLGDHTRDYLVYFVTFLIVGTLWWRHHLIYRYIKRTSAVTIWINTFVLALVALLPYPVAVLSEGFGLGLPLLMLLVPLTGIGILLWAQWELSVREGLVIPGLPVPTLRYMRAQLLASPIVLLAACGLAALSWKYNSEELFYLAAGVWVILLFLPLPLARRWPVPEQAIEVMPDALSSEWESAADSEAEQATAVRGLLARIRNGSDTDRLKVLTDGVVAIAVTILALQLRPPAAGTATTNPEVLDNLLAMPGWTYLSTFLLISLFWRGHVRIFGGILGADTVMLWLNLVFLMFLSFLPMPAELIAKAEDADSVSFYMLAMFTTSASLFLLGYYARDTRKLAITVGTRRQRLLSTARLLTLSVSFLIALVLVFVFQNPGLANMVWVSLIVIGQVTRVLQRRWPDPEGAAAQPGS